MATVLAPNGRASIDPLDFLNLDALLTDEERMIARHTADLLELRARP